MNCSGPCNPTEGLDEQSIAVSLIIMLVLALAARIFAYIGLVFISSPKKPKIEPVTKRIDKTDEPGSAASSNSHLNL